VYGWRTGYEARLTAEQPSKKEILFEIICPGRKSYLVSGFIVLIACAVLQRSRFESLLVCSAFVCDISIQFLPIITAVSEKYW